MIVAMRVYRLVLALGASSFLRTYAQPYESLTAPEDYGYYTQDTSGSNQLSERILTPLPTPETSTSLPSEYQNGYEGGPNGNDPEVRAADSSFLLFYIVF